MWFVTVLAVFLKLGAGKFHDVRILQMIFSPFSLTFLAGYFLGLLYANVRLLPLPLALTFLCAGVVGLCAGISWNPDGEPYPNNNCLYRFVGYGIPCALIVAASLRIETSLPRKIGVLSVLGNISYAIYLTHFVTIVAFYDLSRSLHLQQHSLAILVAFVCFVACLVVAYLFNRIVEVRLMRLSRTLLEGPHRPSRVET